MFELIDSPEENSISRTFNEIIKLEESYNSRPYKKINLPEVKNLNCDFVYNYFTPDERVNPSGTSVSLNNVREDDATWIADSLSERNGTPVPPRKVTINFEKPAFANISDDNTDLSGFVDLINFEGAINNKVHVGVELYDTGKERKIYKMLKASALFNDIDLKDNSQRQAANILHDKLNEKGGLKGEDKKILFEAFNNVQEEGFEVSDQDISRSIVNSSVRASSEVNLGIQLHVGHMSDLLLSSNLIATHVFGDELKSAESFALEKSSNVRNNPNFYAGNFYYSDYAFSFEPYESIYLGTSGDEGVTGMFFAGYYVEKYQLKPDGSLSLIKKEILGKDTTQINDGEVAYGKLYKYKVRTLFSLEITQLDVIHNSGTIFKNKYLIASEGKVCNADCIERQAPEPPEGLRFKFDYRHLVPHIHWQFPLNKKRDIKKFQVFKRSSVVLPFVAIAEIDFDNSIFKTNYNEKVLDKNVYKTKSPVLSFMDKSFKEGDKPIYSVVCIDAHGLTSNYSAQYQIERNARTNTITRTLVSRKGAPKSMPNFYLNVDAFQDSIKSSGHDRIKIFFTPEYYQVLKNKTAGNSSEEIDMKLLATDNSIERYIINFINVDNKKSANIMMKIKDDSFPDAIDQDYFKPGASLSPKFDKNNSSFS
jgi:hypothetical protein